jgi:PAS domain S-box-containing protein
MKATAAKKVAGTWQDITEKEKQRVELKNVIESITDGFFILDNDWIITYWNKAVADMSGISSDEMVGQSFLDYFKDMENLKFYSECRLSKQENISVHFEEYYPPANMWIKVNAYPSENGLTVFCKNISRQKSAEVAMKLSNDRYNMIVNATNDLVWDWDIITGEIDRNCHGVRRVYGHDSNDSIRTNQLWAAHIHPLDKERIDRLIAYYISSENESSFNFEYRFRREDGEYNYIDDNGYIIRNELGIVTRMIGAARDVTESKKNAQSIEESEQRYKLFVQQNTDAIWRIELNDAQPVDTPTEELMQYCLTNAYVAECNDAFAKTYGFDNAEKIIGLPLKEILSPENTSSIQFLRKFLENNFKVADEISRGYDNAGNRLIFLNNMSGIIENGHIKRAWGTQRNITQQKLTEESLLASEEQYRYLFNNNPACIFIWDFETLQFIEVNQSAVELYNYSREEFLQMTILDMKLPEDHDTVKEMVEIARTQESYKKTGISRHIDKTGRTIYIEMTSHNIMYKGRKSALAIGNNVTEKIQLENSLNEERKLRQAQITDAVITGQERERSELAEELHDNINQILASTRLYIECAMSDDHVRKDLLDRGRILLYSAMKEIRKLSRTLLPPALDEVSLLEALNDMVEDIQLVNPIDIYRNWDNFTEEAVSPKLKLTIFRIVQEQLNNIHKHAKATKVFINLERQGDFINLSIKDDGIGFNTLTKKTGVGLRNISSRAEVNNGKVQIQSTPGKGCELKVCFPLNV